VCQLRQPLEFLFTDDVVRNQKIFDAGWQQRLGFGHLLTTNADSAGSELEPCNADRFVRFGVRAKAYIGVARMGRHGGNIGIEGVELNHQSRRFNKIGGIARPRRRQRGHVIPQPCVRSPKEIHAPSPPYGADALSG
jgi:hypothetical protein